MYLLCIIKTINKHIFANNLYIIHYHYQSNSILNHPSFFPLFTSKTVTEARQFSYNHLKNSYISPTYTSPRLHLRKKQQQQLTRIYKTSHTPNISTSIYPPLQEQQKKNARLHLLCRWSVVASPRNGNRPADSINHASDRESS